MVIKVVTVVPRLNREGPADPNGKKVVKQTPMVIKVVQLLPPSFFNKMILL